MKKNKKRNELSIFEDFRLKPAKDEWWSSTQRPEERPSEDSLLKLDILCKVNKDNSPVSWWTENPHGRLVQVNEYGELIFSGDERYEKNIPKKSSLKKYKTDIRVYEDPHIEDLVSWWVKDKNGELIQVNTKDEERGIEFKLKSWVRDQAIDAVGLEIRSMKKKAYEYPKEELEEMIKIEENEIIKKKGWKALRIALLSSLGLSWLPFL